MAQTLLICLRLRPSTSPKFLLTARRGLSANKIACTLISMMARSTCSNRRPNTLTQDRISQRRPKPLAPRGRTIHWVKSAALDVDHALPVYPNKRTFSEPRLTSQKGRAMSRPQPDMKRTRSMPVSRHRPASQFQSQTTPCRTAERRPLRRFPLGVPRGPSGCGSPRP
jgi:hypothetical protein